MLGRPTAAAAIAPARRAFSTARPALSNIGRQPIAYDASSVEITFKNPNKVPEPTAGAPGKHALELRKPFTVNVKGPLGTLTRDLMPFVRLAPVPVPRKLVQVAAPAADGTSAAPATPAPTAALSVNVDFPQVAAQRAMWGTSRALLANMVKGVTQGWTASLKLVGVGYRAAVEARTVQLKLGYANTVVIPIPDGVEAKCPAPDQIELTGIDKMLVNQFAATIRSYKPPEPYNQKGIFVNGETIKKKAPKGKKN
ncbi:hypothetical protein GGF32_009799 [Allomyces javanicus]|nr:hypothetical protein GGF32_009799 [Allomyces javanicus]